MHDVISLIGHTPLLCLKNVELPATILVKAEGMNPGGSAKDRVALNMVEDAELCRLIQKEKPLYEICGQLILEANRRGGTDNIAVVLVEIE